MHARKDSGKASLELGAFPGKNCVLWTFGSTSHRFGEYEIQNGVTDNYREQRKGKVRGGKVGGGPKKEGSW